LKDLNIFGKRVLLATDGNNELIRRAFGNIQKVNVMEGSLVNALDVASSDAIIFSKDAVKSLEKRLMKKVKS